MADLIEKTSHVDGRVSWLESIYFQAEKATAPAVLSFRAYVLANDGKWYKQQDPAYWGQRRYSVLCSFGDFGHDGIGRGYKLTLLGALWPLPNVYEAGDFPADLALCPVYDMRRVS